MEDIYLREFQGTKYRTMLVREGDEKDTPTSCKPIVEAKSVYQYIRAGLENKDRECFLSILFNARMIPLGVNLVSIGGLNHASVEPREVFKAAIIASASSLILAHNHPSGDSTPSKEDVDITRSLMSAGKLLGIPIFDHIIVGRDCYCSMKENGDM